MEMFKRMPRIYQRKVLEESCEAIYWAFLMERGTGKTKVGIDTAVHLYRKGEIEGVLIIAPNGVHERWVVEHLPLDVPDDIKLVARVWNNPSTKRDIRTFVELFDFDPDFPLRVVSINVEAFQFEKCLNFVKKFQKAFSTLIILDESTRIKTPSAKRAKRIVSLGKLAKYRRILTGNEVTTSPFDVYMQFKFLDQNFWKMDYFSFTHYYGKWTNSFATVKHTKNKVTCKGCRSSTRLRVSRFYNRATEKFDVRFSCPICGVRFPPITQECRQIIYNEGLFKYPTLEEYQNMEELREKISVCSTRVKKVDCLDLPEKIYDPIYTKMNDQQEALYKELKAKLSMEYMDHEITIMNKISLTLRFQQIVGGFFPETHQLIGKNSPKMEAILYDMEDGLPETTIIWAVFVPEIEYIAKTLRKNYDGVIRTFYGKTPKEERSKIITELQEGRVQFFVANPDVAGTGLNLQRSNLAYYYSTSFKPEPRWQSEDRQHRFGQRNPCVYKDVIIPKTVDDTLQKAREKRISVAEFFKNHQLKDLV
ncbi:MAG: DEAD/DEAH box helicase [Dehalococcoidales bacterium]|jgi:SNF2 family DNA or RNA helicase|nr:DEAD/DEAH box helicase [Syntrophales bacterium]MDX9802915.1 DEAD/DEAH box helicase [Dehalococcoidales bacterium]